MSNDKDLFLRGFSREMLRAAFQSLFWSVIVHRRKREKLTQQQIADKLGTNKSVVSRDLNAPPNWTIDKISDMAEALDLDIEVIARDRHTGSIFTARGQVGPTMTQSSTIMRSNIAGAITAGNGTPLIIGSNAKELITMDIKS